LIKSWIIGLVVAVAIGVGLPEIEVAYACLRPISEGSVWGRALIVVNMIATFSLVGLPACAAIIWWRRRARP
jgi:uncharacterized iron-regulated membrane protein